MTQHEVEQLKDENLQLKEHIQHQDNIIGELRQELQSSRNIIDELWTMNKNLEQRHVSEKKHLFRRIEGLKRKLCNRNCVACTMLWICETEKLGLGVDLCIRQLEKIITAYAGEKIEKDDLKCEQLMEILKKCELVSITAEYKYPSEVDAKLRMIDEAWNRLMTTDGSLRVMILGRIISTGNDEGHAEICDLDTRTFDGKVTIHNPQEEIWGHGNQNDFRKYVFDDDGLILYRVHLEKLKQIITEHEHILHHTGRFDAPFVLNGGEVNNWVPEQ